MSAKQTIRKFSGEVIGYIEESSNGDKRVTDFCGRVLGYYKASSDTTTDFCGRILYRGDMASALLVIRV